MAIILPVPDSTYGEINISLGGDSYDIVFRYNERNPEDPHWMMDIYQEDVEVVLGIKIVVNTPLITHLVLDEFNHGDLFCLQKYKDDLPPTRDNFGVGKSYELVYLPYTEWVALIS